VIDPTDIVDNLVTLLKDIPDLVTAVGGDGDRIYGYFDEDTRYPNLEMAKYQMLIPSVMVTFQRTDPASFGGFEVWQHTLSIYLRAPSTAACFYLFRLLTKGVPTSLGTALQYAAVHESCQPMNTPSLSRQTDAAGVDYYEVSMSFTEIGDD
jgi:hypothetical protein